MTIEQATVTSPDTQTCPDCQGHGEFVTGPYSRPCGECHGEGVRVVTAKCDACGDSYPAGSGTLFRFWSGKVGAFLCPGCTAEALTDTENWTRVGHEPTPAPAYVGPRALDARTGDLLVWRSGAYMPAAERDYYAGCKRGLARVAA